MSEKDSGYEVFISYRHPKDGDKKGELRPFDIAGILRDKLSPYYTVFWDEKSMAAGEFLPQIEKAILSCKYFILLLNEGALDRCIDENDVVLQEILCAKKNNKTIIPIIVSEKDIRDFEKFAAPINKINEKIKPLFPSPKDNQGQALHRETWCDDIVDKLLIRMNDINDGMRQEITKNYVNPKRKELSTLKLLGQSVPFDNYYVAQRITEIIPEAEKAKARKEGREVYPRTISIENSLMDKDEHIAVVGLAGMGKSLLVQHLMRELLKEGSDIDVFKRKGYFPILIKLTDYKDKRNIVEKSVRQYIIEKTRIKACDLYEICRNMTLVLILDGMDEVGDDITQIVGEISEFVAICKDIKCIFTSRPLGKMIEGDDFSINSKRVRKYTISDFSTMQRNEYVKKYFSVEGGEERANDFIKSMEQAEDNNTNLKEILYTPFLLSMTLKTYKGSFPQSIVELYKRATDQILFERESEEDATKPKNVLPPAISSKETMLHLIGCLAFNLYDGTEEKKNRKNKVFAFVKSRDRITKIITNEIINIYYMSKYKANKLAKAFLKYIKQRSVFVANTFLHQTFQEYFAACYMWDYLDTSELNDLLDKKKEDEYWKNVFSMLLRYIDVSEPIDESYIVKAFDKLLAGYLEKILDYYTDQEWDATSCITPDYNWLCKVAGELEHHRTEAQSRIIATFLLRGVLKDVNVCSELFYYIPVYNMFDGIWEGYKIVDKALLNDGYDCKRGRQQYFAAYMCYLVQRYFDKKISPEFIDAEIKVDRDDISKFNFWAENNASGLSYYNRPCGPSIHKQNTCIVFGKNCENLHSSKFNCINQNFCRIWVDNKNDRYKSINNCLIEVESGMLILGCNASVIPMDGSVKSIGDYAFSGCAGLLSVEIPNSVIDIRKNPFTHCIGLKNITVLNGNKKYHSASNCLIESESKILIAGCSTSRIQTDGSITYIGEEAFCGCKQLTSINIPENITKIGERAFIECTGLENIKIPYKMKYIGNCAFHSCEGLKKIAVDSRNTEYNSEGNCLIETAKKALILGCITSEIPGNGSVSIIGDGAFFGCKNLTSITIPDSVTSIGKRAFSECTGLTSITIPDSVTSIDYEAFFNCTGLSSITIGNGVTSICDTAFRNCTRLTNITIPDSVTYLGNWVFSDCTGLTSITIPDRVTSIGSVAFSGCTGLTNITIGNGVTSISRGAFFGCTNLHSIKCRALSKPEGWSDSWNEGCEAVVEWGYKGE